jgi:hypothetical protein
MSRPCPGGCGHRLHDCCEAQLGEPHQSSCTSPSGAVQLLIDMDRIHRGHVIRIADSPQVRLVCEAGCDVTGATVYDIASPYVLEGADPNRFCPRLQEVA